MALKLGGVNDEKMLPARGQTVLVRNDPGIMCANSGTDDGEDEVCYIMQRAAGEFSKYPFTFEINRISDNRNNQEVGQYSVAATKKEIGTRNSIPTSQRGS